VCIGCYEKLSKTAKDKERSYVTTSLIHVYSTHFNSRKSADFSYIVNRHASSSRKHRSARDFDADLQRAIQLSLTESDGPTALPYNSWQTSEPPLVDRRTRPAAVAAEEEDDPELRAAIEASLREANAPKPSAPVATPYEEREEYSYRTSSSYMNDRNEATPVPTHPPLPNLPNHDLHPREEDAILTFNQTVQDAQAQGTSDLSRMTNVHELYDRSNALRPKLALNLDETGRKERMY